MTPASSTTTYCTGAQCVTFFDVRFLGRLLNDTGTAVAAADVAADANLNAELMAASGEVEASVLCGGRYAPSDLAGLQASGAVGGMFLAKMVATIAVWNLMERRDPMAPMPDRVARVLENMERLRSGENIFGFVEVQAAGNASTQPFYDTQAALENSPVYQARRMFGPRHLNGMNNDGY